MSLKAKLEALLFASEIPVEEEVLVRLCDQPEDIIRKTLDELIMECEEHRGIRLIKIAGGYQFCTKPEYAELISLMRKPGRNKLSRAQLEVLAVVAYRQPVTAAEVEAVRGVQSDYGLRVLLDRRLIIEAGRKAVPGRPNLYATSDQFLHLFGLASLSELPPLAADALQPKTLVESNSPA